MSEAIAAGVGVLVGGALMYGLMLAETRRGATRRRGADDE